MQEELADAGLTIIAVAIDSDLEAVREWAAHAPELTILIDRDFTVAEQYGIVNVPATVWIDEDGRVVRPADTAMADDRFRAFAHVDSSVHHEQLRAWVNHGERLLDDATVADLMEQPSPELQQARLHRRIAVELHDRSDIEGAREHLASAAALAPNDWTIRRGSMPMNDIDPFGNEFFTFVGEWMEAGSPGYRLAAGREYPEDPKPE
ncbi:MAG: Redoxin domain protein [Ilumatobacteraceae bacterium]|nr:Redoxin domain protein [Ilumatobacteraceae bacterium]